MLSKKEIEQLKEIITLMAGDLSDRLDRIELRLDRLEERMDRLEKRMDALEMRMDRLEKRMDRLEARMDRLEEVVGRHDNRIGILEISVLNTQNIMTAQNQRLLVLEQTR